MEEETHCSKYVNASLAGPMYATRPSATNSTLWFTIQ